MDTPEILGTLRNEIVESQKTQADFLKWKLIAVAAVSSISLGFTPVANSVNSDEANRRGLELLLCAIPLICAYIDFVSLHIMIRIVTIGTYLKKIGSDYEGFVFFTRAKGANPFIFETAALHGSSFVFNLVLIAISFSDIAVSWIRTVYCLGGVSGLIVTAISWVSYAKRARRIEDLAQNQDQEARPMASPD